MLRDQTELMVLPGHKVLLVLMEWLVLKVQQAQLERVLHSKVLLPIQLHFQLLEIHKATLT